MPMASMTSTDCEAASISPALRIRAWLASATIDAVAARPSMLTATKARALTKATMP